MMEYLQGKKSLSLLLKRKLQRAESVKKSYYNTITVTKSGLDEEMEEVEAYCFDGNTCSFTTRPFSIAHAVDFSHKVAENKQVIAFSNRWQLYLPYHTFLYFITRLLKPDLVIETGVERGSSTYMMLSAMELNEKGVLHSVELCKNVSLGKVMVPLALMLNGEDELKQRWVLHMGDSRKVLPSLLFDDHLQPTIFVAGSDHSYPTQQAELVWARNFVKSGVVICDRPDFNRFKALDNVFPLSQFPERYVLPERSVKSALQFTVIQI